MPALVPIGARSRQVLNTGTATRDQILAELRRTRGRIAKANRELTVIKVDLQRPVNLDELSPEELRWRCIALFSALERESTLRAHAEAECQQLSGLVPDREAAWRGDPRD